MVKSIKQNAEKYYKVFDQIRFNIFLERYFITYTATLENTIKSTSYHCVKTILIIQRQIRHSLIQRLPNAECLQQKR
jgi:Fic family protein